MSSDDPFVLLELDRDTATEKDVKRAYARRLKVTRPDEDPQGFMALRNAMEYALNDIRWRDEDAAYEDEAEDDEPEPPENPDPFAAPDPPPEPEPEDCLTPDDSVATSEPALPGAPWGPPQPDEAEDDDQVPEAPETVLEPDLQPDYHNGSDLAYQQTIQEDANAVNEAMEAITEMLDQPDPGVEWVEWLRILDHDRLQSLDAFQMLSARLRNEICNRTEFQPEAADARLKGGVQAEAFLKLDERFGWSHQAISNWYENQQNHWIRRLVEDAEYKTGKRIAGAWGRPPSRMVEQTTRQTYSPPPDKKQPVRTIVWFLGRLVLIAILIRLIVSMIS